MRGIVPAVLAWLFLLGCLGSATVQAREIALARACHAVANTQTGWALLAKPGRAWNCGPGNWPIAGPGIDLAFTLATDPRTGHPVDQPRSLVTQASRYEAMTIWVLDRDGAVRSARYTLAQAHYLPAGPLLSVPLPPLTAQTTHVVVRIERPWSKVTASEAWLDTDPQGTGWTIRRVAMMAMICGLLIVPLVLNGAFYGVLRERYVLYHMVLTAGMLAQVVIGSGFLRLITFVSPALESPLSNACFVITGSAAMLFAAEFIEPDRLNDRLRKALRLVAPVVLGIGLITTLSFEALRPWAALMVHLDMIPVMGLIGAAAVSGCRRGSISAYFLAAGWAPALLVGFWKVAAYLVPALHPLDALVVFHLGLAVYVAITTFGIIYRMIALRRERDDANARAIELEGVAGRDALTGMRNRHSIERRFDDLFRMGFRTMAVIDLDHFKVVNDEHGHTVGDEVLKAAAQALREDADTRAIRLGGEEFLLLLRGIDAAERAERVRRAISVRVAADVPGLKQLVTASMGLVEHDTAGTLQIEFEALYAHCDRLLYEAKRLGRNRTMRERVTAFGQPLAVSTA